MTRACRKCGLSLPAEKFRRNARRAARSMKYACDKLNRTLDSELTSFVYEEAHILRELRNNLTGIEWNVDHVLPLRGKLVSGLHTWNNFAVIPKLDNIRKSNSYIPE